MLALNGGTIYVSADEDPIRDGVILIDGTTIAAVGHLPVPRDAQVIDCTGRTITAGFWNSHVHFFERKWANVTAIPAPELSRQLRDMLGRYGFTSVFDLSSMWENTQRLRARIESGEVAGPRIRSTGEGLVPPGALPPDQVLNMMGVFKTPLPEVTDAAQAATASKKLLDQGVDGIKLFASSPSGTCLPESAIQAAVTEARRIGKPVFVHPNSGADVMTAIRNGVDVIAHTTPRSGPWDDSILAARERRHVALTPTLTLWKYFARHDRVSTQDQIVKTAVGQLGAWIAAGGIVLFGTDLGAVDYDPTEEYALMAEAGMSFPQILRSLTISPAEQFGESNRLGRIAKGFQADLVVLRDDPANDVRGLADVEQTFRAGRLFR